MKGGMGSTQFCSEFWLGRVLAGNDIDLEEVKFLIFLTEMFGVP